MAGITLRLLLQNTMLKKAFCAGIIPIKKEQNQWMVLLVQHTKGHYWAFPKGHFDLNEQAKQTATRELKEETNLEIDRFLFDKPFHENYQFECDGQQIDKSVDYFAAIVKGDLKLNQPHEIENAAWFTFQDAIKTITYVESKQVFKRFLQQFVI